MLDHIRRILLCALIITLLVPFVPSITGSSAQLTSDPRFGIVEAYRAPEQAGELNVSWTRMLFWWSLIQPHSQNEWNTSSIPDPVLAQETEDGREIVGLIAQTPSWANGGNPVTVPPLNLDLPYNDPNNYWGAFITRLVSTYKGRINTWVIWNEPDVWDPASPGFTWTGTVKQFYQLQKVAYLAAKAANPDATILLPGLSYWWDAQYNRPQYLDRLLDVAAADPTAQAHNWYFDAAVLHLYNDPKMLYDGPTIFKNIMAKHGIQKPVWINETNVDPWDDPSNPLPRTLFRSTQDEQASYIIQAMAYALVAGVERVAIFKMRDDHVLPGNEEYGLVRKDGSLRPAFYAYQTAIRYFAGVESGKVTKAGNVTRIILEKPQERITVLWDSAPQDTTAYIWASARQATLVDKLGNTRTLVPTNGVYTFALPGATANTVPDQPDLYYIGGSPVIVIEPKDQSYVPASAPGTSTTETWTAPQTGYTVSGKWLEFYRTHGWIDNMGYPRSNVVTDPITGLTVQYFQRVILEWHPENPDPFKIQRHLIEDTLSPGFDPPIPPPAKIIAYPDKPGVVKNDCRYYPYSAGSIPTGLGHCLSNYAPNGQPTYFKDFFDSHGGLDIFGYPKEEPKLRNGLWTQRFQAAVLEYHPENDRPGNIPGTNVPYRNFRVLLRLLGDDYMRKYNLLYE